MPQTTQGLLGPPIGRYGIAVVAVAAGTLLRWSLTLWVGPGLPTYVTFYPAVMFVAILCGLRAGLAATVMTAAVVDYWLLPPEGWSFWKLGLMDAVGLVLFLGMGAFMSFVAEYYRRSREKAAAYEKELAFRQGEALRIAEMEREEEKLRKLNRTLQAHARSDQALFHATDEASYLQEVCRIVVEDCGHAMVWAGFAQEDEGKTVRPAVWSGFEDGYLDTLKLTWGDGERGQGPTGKAIRTGEVCVCRNMLTDPLFEPWREQAVARGYASSIALPLLGGGKAFGALTVYSREADPFSAEEVRLLTELAGDFSHGIIVLRLRAAHAAAEKDLRLNERRLRTILDALPVAIFLSDAAGNVIFTNGAVDRIWGLSAHVSRDQYGQYKGWWRATGQPVEGDQWALARTLDTGEPFTNEPVEIEMPSGERKIIHNFAIPIRGESGPLLGVVVVTEDITLGVRAEESLRESEERFRLLFQQAAVGIKRLDRQGRILEVNDKQCEILGYSREELLRMSLADFTHGEDLPIEQAELERLWAGEIASYHIEKRCLRKDGGLIWVRVTSSLPTGGGPAEWCISIVEDITLRKRAEEDLRRTADELGRSNRDLEQFAYVSSHDLQEPLRMVTGFMGLFQQKYQGQIDESADKYIHFAVDGAKRMQRLIEDLLTYSRVGSKGKEPAPTDAGEVVRGVLAGLGPSIEESKAEVSVGELPTVKADATQLAQVFQNLIANAVKFRGDGAPKIRVEARRGAEHWVFSVADNGIGIDPEFAPKVFVIFQRLHTKEKYPGTGIGLAICKKIVERHGGRIWVESQPGRGATFYFTIPSGE
jgi:PAS domain S-box-containing protein